MNSASLVRRGYWLFSLARVGQALAFAGLLVFGLSGCVLLAMNALAAFSPAIAKAGVALDGPGKGLAAIGLAGVCWYSRCAFQALAAIGALAKRGEGISPMMLRLWVRLRNAFGWGGTLYVLSGLLSAAWTSPAPFRIDPGIVYFIALGVLCLHTVVHLLQEAGALQEENQGFV